MSFFTKFLHNVLQAFKVLSQAGSMGSSDSDSDADKKKKVGKKRIVRKNRKNDDDDNFLKGDK